jgi:hypothetical protein
MSQILCYETDSGVPNVLMTDISGVVINAGKKAELRFVPQKAGIYYREGSPLWILGLQIGKPGFIYVKD